MPMFVTGSCFVHGGLFSFDQATVPSVLVDPETGRPPDVDQRGEPIEPDPVALGRSVRQPICPRCVAAVNPERAQRGLAPLEEGKL